jgi:hypothetical protein
LAGSVPNGLRAYQKALKTVPTEKFGTRTRIWYSHMSQLRAAAAVRGKKRQWVRVQEFHNHAAGLGYEKNRDLNEAVPQKLRNRQSAESGVVTRFMECTFPDCKTAWKVEYHSNDKAFLSKAGMCDHDPTKASKTKAQGIPQAQKDEIVAFMGLAKTTKTSKILGALAATATGGAITADLPSKKQISNFVHAQEKKANESGGSTTKGDVEALVKEFCREKVSKKPGFGVNTPYIFSVKLTETFNSERTVADLHVSLGISSDWLLAQPYMYQFRSFNLDGTYRLTEVPVRRSWRKRRRS